jgi:hypothetical protein
MIPDLGVNASSAKPESCNIGHNEASSIHPPDSLLRLWAARRGSVHRRGCRTASLLPPPRRASLCHGYAYGGDDGKGRLRLHAGPNRAANLPPLPAGLSGWAYRASAGSDSGSHPSANSSLTPLLPWRRPLLGVQVPAANQHQPRPSGTPPVLNPLPVKPF